MENKTAHYQRGHIKLIRLKLTTWKHICIREKNLDALPQRVVLPLSRFRSSSSAFYSSSIQLDVSYTQPSATTSMLYPCISVRRAFLHSIRGGTRNGWDLRAMREPMCTQLRTRNSRTTMRSREHSRFFYSSVIKQFNITNTGLDNAMWCEALRLTTFTDRVDLYCPDSCAVVPSRVSRKTFRFKDGFSSWQRVNVICIACYHLPLFPWKGKGKDMWDEIERSFICENYLDIFRYKYKNSECKILKSYKRL